MPRAALLSFFMRADRVKKESIEIPFYLENEINEPQPSYSGAGEELMFTFLCFCPPLPYSQGYIISSQGSILYKKKRKRFSLWKSIAKNIIIINLFWNLDALCNLKL